jgi:hypothetical protein
MQMSSTFRPAGGDVGRDVGDGRGVAVTTTVSGGEVTVTVTTRGTQAVSRNSARTKAVSE